MLPTHVQLTKLLVKRLVESFNVRGCKVPPGLATGSVYVNTLVDNLRSSKLIVDRSAFSAWRERGACASCGARDSSDASCSAPASSGESCSAEVSSRVLGKRPSPRLAQGPVRRYEPESDEDSGEFAEEEEHEGCSAENAVLLDSDS